jgi:hypothetical protein
MNAEPLSQRLERLSEPLLDGCRAWSGQVGGSGYGVIGVGHSRKLSAHKVAFEQANGPVPVGLCVLHRCDNRLCVNPAHLFLGTKADNSRDMVAKGRNRSPIAARTHCPQGHPHSGQRNSRGARICPICHREAVRRHKEARGSK